MECIWLLCDVWYILEEFFNLTFHFCIHEADKIFYLVSLCRVLDGW